MTKVIGSRQEVMKGFAGSFGINENIKRCLIERFLEKQRRDIHNQIGSY